MKTIPNRKYLSTNASRLVTVFSSSAEGSGEMEPGTLPTGRLRRPKSSSNPPSQFPDPQEIASEKVTSETSNTEETKSKDNDFLREFDQLLEKDQTYSKDKKIQTSTKSEIMPREIANNVILGYASKTKTSPEEAMVVICNMIQNGGTNKNRTEMIVTINNQTHKLSVLREAVEFYGGKQATVRQLGFAIRNTVLAISLRNDWPGHLLKQFTRETGESPKHQDAPFLHEIHLNNPNNTIPAYIKSYLSKRDTEKRLEMNAAKRLKRPTEVGTPNRHTQGQKDKKKKNKQK
jgi:hypothetical protein